MASFMPTNLTSAIYNQSKKGEQYNYDINISAVNKSLNEEGHRQNSIYFSTSNNASIASQNRNTQGSSTGMVQSKNDHVIIEADEESYC